MGELGSPPIAEGLIYYGEVHPGFLGSRLLPDAGLRAKQALLAHIADVGSRIAQIVAIAP